MIWMALVGGFGLVVALVCWRQFDRRANAAAWRALAAPSADGRVFEPAMVAALPEPARRYFAFTIRSGAPIRTAVRLEMTGELGLGTKDSPGYRRMHAEQVLAPPDGLVWRVESGLLGGSDGVTPTGSWTRFWLLGLVPVVRAEGPDHRRSAFGRVISEAAFWAPASLLPSERVAWEAVSDDTARAVVRFGNLEQAVDITVDEAGAPIEVVIPRWSNENAERRWREQPFGGNPSRFREVDGYRLPTRVEGGNHFGTPDYFPFYKAEVTAIEIL